MKRKIGFLFLLSLLFFRYSQSTQLTGNISSYFKSYQTQDLYTQEKKSYLRAYQGFIFDLNKIGINDLSFHTYFRSTTDFFHKNSTDPSTKIYNFYLNWVNIKKVLNLRLGRQFIYAGVGNGTMDGLKMDFKPSKKIQLTGYIGFQLPKEKWSKIDTWKKSHIFGGELTTAYFKNTRLSISYVQKKREKAFEEHLIGIKASCFYKKVDFFSQFYYDLVYKKIQNFSLRGTGTKLLDKLYLSLEYQFRRPSIYSNSILSVFAQGNYSIIRLSGAYQPLNYFRFSSEYELILYKSDNSNQARFGIEYAFLGLGLKFRQGYGGESNGFYGNFIHSFEKDLVFLASVDYGKYKLDEEQKVKEETFTISSRIEWKVLKSFRFAAEFQDIRNKVKSYDIRLAVKINYRFRITSKNGTNREN